MIRRFVNVVAEDYKRGLYSLHRLDVSKHLFYPSTAQAQASNSGGGGGDGEIERLQELPAPCVWMQPALTTVARSPNNPNSKRPFFGLLSPCSSENRIISIDELGRCTLFNADERLIISPMPDLEEFKGHVHVTASIADDQAAAGAKEQGTYILHGVEGVAYGLDFRARFDVLRFGHPGGGGGGFLRADEGWHWESLPLPPFVYGSHEKNPSLIISYAVVEDGRTICLSTLEQDTFCFDTTKREWWKAGYWDRVLPFDERAVYVPDLKFWLGFCLRNPNNLVATSGLSDMALYQPSQLQPLWQNFMARPMQWMTIKSNFLNLGSGKFAIAKVYKVIGESTSMCFSDWGMMVGDEFVVLTGVEIFSDNSNSQGLQIIQHKSIRYTCANNRIHQVL